MIKFKQTLHIKMEANTKIKLIENYNYYFCIRELIQKAEKEIIISAFEFDSFSDSSNNFGNQILKQLIEKKSTLDSIQVYLNSSNKSNRMYFINRDTYTKLFNARIECHMTPHSKTLHAKFIIIDGHKILLGSHNISDRSMKRCKEVSLYIEDPEIANKLKEFLKIIFS